MEPLCPVMAAVIPSPAPPSIPGSMEGGGWMELGVTRSHQVGLYTGCCHEVFHLIGPRSYEDETAPWASAGGNKVRKRQTS